MAGLPGGKNLATRRYNGNGEPVCARRMAQITPSMFAGHDVSCPYEDEARGESAQATRRQISVFDFDFENLACTGWRSVTDVRDVESAVWSKGHGSGDD